jgi:hypothetical protein
MKLFGDNAKRLAKYLGLKADGDHNRATAVVTLRSVEGRTVLDIDFQPVTVEMKCCGATVPYTDSGVKDHFDENPGCLLRSVGAV